MFSRGLIVFVLLVALGGFASPGSASAGGCAGARARSQARAEIVTGSGPLVRVIGDSYSVGAGLSDMGDSWPSYLPGRVVVDGFSGSGFTTRASHCPGVAYADRAARALAGHPRLIVVEGGLNDYRSPTPEIEAGVRRLLVSLRGVHVVLVGPAMAPSRAHQVARVDAALARVAADEGATYVSTMGWALEYQADGLHLTARGSRDFGRKVTAVLVAG